VHVKLLIPIVFTLKAVEFCLRKFSKLSYQMKLNSCL